jgi:hypothetical protein
MKNTIVSIESNPIAHHQETAVVDVPWELAESKPLCKPVPFATAILAIGLGCFLAFIGGTTTATIINHQTMECK